MHATLTLTLPIMNRMFFHLVSFTEGETLTSSVKYRGNYFSFHFWLWYINWKIKQGKYLNQNHPVWQIDVQGLDSLAFFSPLILNWVNSLEIQWVGIYGAIKFHLSGGASCVHLFRVFIEPQVYIHIHFFQWCFRR